MRIDLRKYFLQQQVEIFSDPCLRLYGIFLAGTQALSLYFMRHEALAKISYDALVVRWPGFPDFFEIKSEIFWKLYLIFWALAIAVTFFCFIKKNKIGYWGLALCFFLKGFLSFQSYAYMGNYHYMPAVLTALFLFIPLKKEMISLFLVFFYVAAGLLKLNPEWLLGQALLKPVPKVLAFFGNFNFSFIVFLELVLAWFLLVPEKSIRYFSFFCFCVFHVVSWYWVGYFYPLIMLQLLMIFPLQWYLKSENFLENITRQMSWPQYACIFLFWVAQALPFMQKGDSALTGSGRLWSLNMYDAQSQCFDVTLIQKKNEWIEVSGSVPLTAVRVHCDPIVYFDRLQKACAQLKAFSPEAEISLFLHSKRKTDLAYQPVLELNQFCSYPRPYRLFGWNEWLKK